MVLLVIMYFWFIISIIFCCVLLFLWRRRSCQSYAKRETASVMIVAGSGGHTSEMLRLVEALSSDRYTPRVYLVSRTDVTSENRIHELELRLSEKSQRVQEYCVLRIPRSREVHQSWMSTVLTSAFSVAFSVPLVFQRKPDVILCNGPGTCVPICLAAFLFRALGVLQTKLVYVESICRVDDLSLSGKMLYRFVDHLIVQWPELCQKYPRAQYLGLLS